MKEVGSNHYKVKVMTCRELRGETKYIVTNPGCIYMCN